MVYCRSGNIREVLISREGQIREFRNLAKIIILIALLKKKWKFANSKLRENEQINNLPFKLPWRIYCTT